MASFRDRLSHVFKEDIMRRQYAMLLAMLICIVCIVGTIYVNRVELGLGSTEQEEIVNE
jgi:cell division protein FtsL